MAGSCFGASDHGPVSFRRVGQSVDLPVKARRWGHDLRGSRQSGWLKSWSRPPQPRRGFSHVMAASAVRPVAWCGISGPYERPRIWQRRSACRRRHDPASFGNTKRLWPAPLGITVRPPCPCWNVAAACGDGRAATCSWWRRHGGGAAATGRRRRVGAALGLIRPTGVGNRVERGAAWPRKRGVEVRPQLGLSSPEAGSWWRWHAGRKRPLMRLGGVCGGRVGDDR